MQLNRVSRVKSKIPLRKALISVADKSGLDSLLAGLWETSPECIVYSTGGTYRHCLRIADATNREDRIREVSAYTGQPEMQGGLVKTLDWKIYLGLLAEDFNEEHQADLKSTGSIPFDLVVCNFYPFEETTASETVSVEDARTHIDIGGPTMVRAAAKNFLHVTVLTSPAQYGDFTHRLRETGGFTTLQERFRFSREAFHYIAAYDEAIDEYLSTLDPSVLEAYEW